MVPLSKGYGVNLPQVRTLARRLSRSYIVLIAVGIVIGLQIAPPITDAVTDPVTGSVAVVTLEGGIDGENAASVATRLKQAREDPTVDAVVLRINTIGGASTANEGIYLAVSRTAAEMPVVASVNSVALSGGYLAATPADEIYAKPASLVGNVGTFLIVPQQIDPIDQLITTGPAKLDGGDRREWFYNLESMNRAFVGAVISQRGDRLELSREELAVATTCTGGEALQNGLIDEIGGLDAAVQRAADLAGLVRWDRKTLGYDETVTFVSESAYRTSRTPEKELVSPARFVVPPRRAIIPQRVMLPRSVVGTAIRDARSNGRNVSALRPPAVRGSEANASAT